MQQLLELQQMAANAGSDGLPDPDGHFFAEQNARLVVNAEEYYRAMFRGGVASWNLRDRHMAETLDELAAHLERTSGSTKVVVWAHNSHLGDARATELGQSGELNVGQLVRERVGDGALLVGFTTYSGTVTAASDWGGSGRAQARAPRAPRQLGGAAARGRRLTVPAGSIGAEGPAARTGDRRRLPARDRAHLPLLPRPDRRPVRRGHPHRPDNRGRAARALQRVGARRAPETYPTGV